LRLFFGPGLAFNPISATPLGFSLLGFPLETLEHSRIKKS
jgi:hypothetical protein